MKLSPVNIKRQEFSKAVRGYSIGEVNDFLEKVAEEVESALKENETLRRTVDHLNLDIERYKTIEDSLQKALIAAQESSGLALQKANDEAARIVEEAGNEATVILGDSQDKAIKLQTHIAELEERMAWLIARLSAMVDTQENLLGLKTKSIDKMPEVKLVEEISEAKVEPTDSVIAAVDASSEMINSNVPERETVITKIEMPEPPEVVEYKVDTEKPEEIKKKVPLSDEEQKRKKLAEMFFAGGSEKIDLNNIVDD
ncbi:MAG: DivIVA domain-containing protein [Ignavibacteriales bacterium]|nr:DivIVA domain-containing protein [Ignavibacteriales bacterium]